MLGHDCRIGYFYFHQHLTNKATYLLIGELLMTFFVIAHSIMIVCYTGITYFVWRGWKRNKLEKKFNTAIRQSAQLLAESVEDQIKRNEKLVAEAKSQIAMAMAAMEADMATSSPSPYDLPSDPEEMINDPGMLASIITAIVIKYGDMRIGMKDMMSLTEDHSISIYIDTGSKEMVLSTEHDLGDRFSYVNFSNSDEDETYH
jgi:hypothetical protein